MKAWPLDRWGFFTSGILRRSPIDTAHESAGLRYPRTEAMVIGFMPSVRSVATNRLIAAEVTASNRLGLRIRSR